MSCRQMEQFDRMGVGIKNCGDCERLDRLQVLSSPAGYYLGTLEDGMPYCRATVYLFEVHAHNMLKEVQIRRNQ